MTERVLGKNWVTLTVWMKKKDNLPDNLSSSQSEFEDEILNEIPKKSWNDITTENK